MQLGVHIPLDHIQGRVVRGREHFLLTEIELLGYGEMNMDQFGHLLVEPQQGRCGLSVPVWASCEVADLRTVGHLWFDRVIQEPSFPRHRRGHTRQPMDDLLAQWIGPRVLDSGLERNIVDEHSDANPVDMLEQLFDATAIDGRAFVTLLVLLSAQRFVGGRFVSDPAVEVHDDHVIGRQIGLAARDGRSDRANDLGSDLGTGLGFQIDRRAGFGFAIPSD